MLRQAVNYAQRVPTYDVRRFMQPQEDARLTEAKKVIKDLKFSVTCLEGQNALLKDRIAELEQQLKEKDAQLTAKDARIDSLTFTYEREKARRVIAEEKMKAGTFVIEKPREERVHMPSKRMVLNKDGDPVKIIQTILDFVGMDAATLKKPTTKREVVSVRHTICYFLIDYTRLPMDHIAELACGKKDHSYANYGKRAVENRISKDPYTRQKISDLRKLIEAL